MSDQELIQALREHAEWARANEWETPITLGDDLVAAADRIEAQAEFDKARAAGQEWNDGKKDRIYCLGWVDPMTDAPLPECVACPDFVDKAQNDLEVFYGRADND